MKRLIIGTAIAAACLFASGAFAQGYVGASLGQSDFDVDCTGLDTCDTKDTGYKLFGGYMFTPYLGVEAAYVDFGKATGTGTLFVGKGSTLTVTGSLKASGFGLWGVGALPIGNGSVFAKLGLASIENKLDASAGGAFGSNSDKTTLTDIAYGVGGAYNFTPNLGVRVEWERFKGKIPGDEKFDLDLLSAGIYYRF